MVDRLVPQRVTVISTWMVMLLTHTGCIFTTSGYLIGCAIDKSSPTMHTVPPVGADASELGAEVIIHLVNGTEFDGTYQGTESNLRTVYLVWPEDIQSARDSLVNWQPAAGEPLVMYWYRTDSLFFEGTTNDSLWTAALKSDRRKVEYMTPAVRATPHLLIQAHPLSIQEQLHWAERRSTPANTFAVPFDSIQAVQFERIGMTGRVIGVMLGLGGDAFFWYKFAERFQ